MSGGWGRRATLAVLYGCIPVIIQDGLVRAHRRDGGAPPARHRKARHRLLSPSPAERD